MLWKHSEHRETPLTFLKRHLAGDWGELDEHDTRENELSLQHGWRILSAYTLSTGVKVLDHHGSRSQRDDLFFSRTNTERQSFRGATFAVGSFLLLTQHVGTLIGSVQPPAELV